MRKLRRLSQVWRRFTVFYFGDFGIFRLNSAEQKLKFLHEIDTFSDQRPQSQPNHYEHEYIPPQNINYNK